jgi:hypothetical protein
MELSLVEEGMVAKIYISVSARGGNFFGEFRPTSANLE